MIQYLKFRGDLSFRQSPFCDIDAMILSQLSSVDYTGIVPGAEDVDHLVPKKRKECPTISEVAERMTEDLPGYQDTKGNVIELLKLAGASKRFGGIRMDGYIRDTRIEEVKQFSAVTFYINWYTRYIAFRGTDAYIVSWKENFRMNYLYPIPSQSDAVEYLRRMQPSFLGKVMAGGHSKGGNLTIYAGSYIDEKVQRKIKRLYAFDAPGFSHDISEETGFLRIKDRITGYIPMSCCVGRMMQVPYENTVVESDGIGVKQHSMFHWHVEGTGLETVEATDQFSDEITDIIRQWHDAIPEEDMESHVESFFGIFDKNGITRSDQLRHMDGKQMLRIVLGARDIMPEERQFFVSMIRVLWGEGRRK